MSISQLHTPLDYAKAACDTLMRKFAPANLPPVGRFHYHQGVFLSGMQKTYRLCGERKYFDYIKGWVDAMIDENGCIRQYDKGQMDDIMPGLLLFDLYRETSDPRYKKALDQLMDDMLHYRRDPQGGYWHKSDLKDQMWLDGLYMGGPICVRYGAEFNMPGCFDTAIFQALLMEKRTRDPKTGLLYHACDYSREAPWADPETGRSAEFWGRAMGWVPVALLDELDDIPKEYFLRDQVERMIRDLLMALLPHQDMETGLWYQVVNRRDEKENWLETSCTCLYVAAYCKAVRLGMMDKAYLHAARKGYEGVIHRLKENEQGLIIDGVCVGTGVGDLQHYYHRPTSQNDLHGAGAFILMCQEAAQVL